MRSGAEAIRLFFALNPGAAVRQRLAEVQRAVHLPGRPVHSDRLHITLAFLGQVDAEQIPILLDCAGSVAFEPCTLVLDRLGWFERAGVAWLAPSSAPEALVRQQEALARALGVAGFHLEERRWVPHLTLYRDLRTAPGKLAFESVEWQVNGFVLMQSVLRKSGPVYRVLERWPSTRRGTAPDFV